MLLSGGGAPRSSRERVGGGLFRECFINGHSIVQALPKRSVFDAEDVGPLRQRVCFAVPRDFRNVALVPLLLRHSNPAAVFRAIITVYVDAVNRQSFLVSVCKCPIAERWIIIPPFAANANTSPPIVGVLSRIWIITAVLHPFPFVIQEAFAAAVLRMCFIM